MAPILLNEREQKIKKCFNKAAQTYDLHAQLQQEIGMDLLFMLQPFLKNIDHIIDLGCGTGLLTKQLADRCHYKKFYAIDIADQLLRQARQRLISYQIQIEENNFQQFHYPACLFDLIFSNMSLHWSTDMMNALLNIKRNMQENGLFAFTIPLKNTFCELNKNAKTHFFSAHEITQFLLKLEFVSLSHATKFFTLPFASLYEALKSIKAVGANYHVGSKTTLCGKSYLKNISNALDQHAKFFLTYEIGYFLVRKKSHVI